MMALRLFLFAIFLTCAGFCNAQQGIPICTQSVSGRVYVPAIQQIEILETGGGLLNFSSANDYEQGVSKDNYCRIRVSSNSPYIVLVKPSTSEFASLTGGFSKPIPSAVLEISSDRQPLYQRLSPEGVSLAQSAGDDFMQEFTVRIRARPGFEYRAGAYQMNLVFSITTP